jgi:hypothetical protein
MDGHYADLIIHHEEGTNEEETRKQTSIIIEMRGINVRINCLLSHRNGQTKVYTVTCDTNSSILNSGNTWSADEDSNHLFNGIGPKFS